MKKIMSIVLVGAVALSFSACGAGSKPSESTVVTTAATTTEATTTTTTEETTTEETTTEYVPTFDDLIPKAGEISVDFGDDSTSYQITENIFKALRLRTNTTAEDYANRFDIKPDYKYSKGVWTFSWGKNQPNDDNTFVRIEITADKEDDKIVLTKDSNLFIFFYIRDYNMGDAIYSNLSTKIGPDIDSADYLKDGYAINPGRSYHNFKRLKRMKKYDYVRWEFEVNIHMVKADLEDL